MIDVLVPSGVWVDVVTVCGKQLSPVQPNIMLKPGLICVPGGRDQCGDDNGPGLSLKLAHRWFLLLGHCMLPGNFCENSLLGSHRPLLLPAGSGL